MPYCQQGHFNVTGSVFCSQCGERLLPPDAAQVTAGQQLGDRYTIERELGQGGFGRTYLARDTHRFHEFCVLKEFAPQVDNPELLQKAEELFAREAGVLYQLQHPQIPQFRELLRVQVGDRPRLYLVQDYVEGPTYQELLRSRLSQGQVFAEAEVVQLLQHLLPVLTYIHTRGVIHRDIAPDNLILRARDRLPVLIDFGGVKQVAATVISGMRGTTPDPTLLGKPGYAAPEQMATGQARPQSDLYALGMTALVLLTGRDPAELAANSAAIVAQLPISVGFQSVLTRLLSRRAEQRYPSAEAVRLALGGQPQAVSPPSPPTPPPQPNARTTAAIAPPNAPTPARWPRFLWAIGLMIAAAGGAWWVWSRQTPEVVESPSPTPTETPSPIPEPSLSPEERARKRILQQRRESLGIDEKFFNTLVDTAFFRKYPERRETGLSNDPADAKLRAEWDALASEYLGRLSRLAAAGRSRLGQYTVDDVKNRATAVNQLDLSSRALNDLTDARFFYWFPEESRGENLLDQPIGQVWQAIADEQLAALQNGQRLKRLTVDNLPADLQAGRTLQPGEGMAYVVALKAGQRLNLQLDAPAKATLLSFYPPQGKAPLLEDSTQQTWQGTATEAGFYEITVVTNTPQTTDRVQYQLQLNVTAATD